MVISGNCRPRDSLIIVEERSDKTTTWSSTLGVGCGEQQLHPIKKKQPCYRNIRLATVQTYHMANRARSVVNGTAADEPSTHKTRFNRKKMPNINLQSDNINKHYHGSIFYYNYIVIKIRLSTGNNMTVILILHRCHSHTLHAYNVIILFVEVRSFLQIIYIVSMANLLSQSQHG